MRSISFLALTVIALSFASQAWAAPTAGITVPKAGDHYYWFVYSDVNGKQITTTPRGFKDKKTTADLPMVKDAVPKQCTLYLLDAKTGNEAVMKVEGKPGESIKIDIKPADMNSVRRVEIEITSADSGASAAAATIKLVDSEKRAQTQVLDPSALGKVTFTDVASGTAKLTVEYGDGKSTSQDVDITSEHASVKIPVVGDIETIARPVAKTKTADNTTDDGQGGGNSFPRALVGLLILSGIIYMAIRTMSNRGAKVRELLKNAGIDIAEESEDMPGQPAAAQPVDPTVCPFCGGKKDANGACACTIGAGPASGTVGGSGPRLIATQGVYAGSIYQIGADAVTIGRDESNTIAFPQDNTSSRRHARIVGSGGQFTIHDEGSSNGTFVNGVKITEQALRPGDEIQVGATRMRFEI